MQENKGFEKKNFAYKSSSSNKAIKWTRNLID